MLTLEEVLGSLRMSVKSASKYQSGEIMQTALSDTLVIAPPDIIIFITRSISDCCTLHAPIPPFFHLWLIITELATVYSS